jgi:hypothetical protein
MRHDCFDATKLIRAGIILVAATTMFVATASEALAKHRKHFARHHCGCHHIRVVQVVASPPPSLGQMRYYGGPKSPMWREVR